MKVNYLRLFCAVFGVWVGLYLSSTSAHAQTNTCQQIQTQINKAISPGICQVIGPNNACYGSKSINASLKPGSGPFANPGNKIQILKLNSMSTVAPNGVGLMVANTAQGPVKIIVFGNTTASPLSGDSYVMSRSANGQLVCEKTPSGMMLQVPPGQTGTIVVNGVTIELGSTVFISTQSDVLFDQDPRINRRQGSANPEANLCSGFDSDCNFAGCAVGQRLVYGPYCREDRYSDIKAGGYRVTLYGQGNVRAGATDFEASGRQRFSFGAKDYSLRRGVPTSYTFCYPGEAAGSVAWESMVESRSSNARIDWITVEYLGADCGTAQRRTGQSPEIMTITTIEGFAQVSSPVGGAGIGQGQALNFEYDGFEPVAMSEVLDSDEIMESTLIDWLTNNQSGLPEVNTGGGTTAPVAQFRQVGLSGSSDGTEFVGLVGEVDAFVAGGVSANAANRGVNSVNYQIFNPQGILVHEQTENNFPFCMFGDSGVCTQFLFAESGGVWPNGEVLERGQHRIDVLVTGSDGATTAMSTSLFLEPQFDYDGPAISRIDISPEPFDSDRGFSVCADSDVYVSAVIYDPSGVRSATLYYQLLSNGSSYSDRTPIEMGEDSGVFYASGISGSGADTISFLILAEDELGNQRESDEYFLNLVSCR